MESVDSDEIPPMTPHEFSMSRKMLSKPERIVFLIDLHNEMGSPWEEEKSRLHVVRDGIFYFKTILS